MTTLLWPVLAAIVVLAIGIAVAAANGRALTEAAGARVARPVGRECAGNGHVYRFHGTGLRCFICGDFAARAEGELYGRAEAVESTGAASHGERVCSRGANWTMPQRPALVLPKAASPQPPVLTRR